MDSLIPRLGLALAIGLLVGLERGWRERDEPDGGRTAGIRTYGITGLFGGIVAALSLSLDSPAVLAAGLLAFAAVFAWFKMRESIDDGSFSVTAVVAGLGVYCLARCPSREIRASRPRAPLVSPPSWPAGTCCTAFCGRYHGSSCGPRLCSRR